MRNAIIKTIMCGAITILAWACSVNHAAKAAETDDFYHIEGNVIIDTEGNRYSCFFRTGQGEMDLEEALEMLNQTQVQEIPKVNTGYGNICQPLYLVGPDEEVTLTSIETHSLGDAKRITPEMIGPGTLSKTVSTTVSSSLTTSVSVGITAKLAIFAEVEAECGVAIQNGTASTDTFAMSFPVSSGKIAAIYFRPYYVVATGNVGRAIFSAAYPQTINGYADGIFYLVER